MPRVLHERSSFVRQRSYQATKGLTRDFCSNARKGRPLLALQFRLLRLFLCRNFLKLRALKGKGQLSNATQGRLTANDDQSKVHIRGRTQGVEMCREEGRWVRYEAYFLNVINRRRPKEVKQSRS